MYQQIIHALARLANKEKAKQLQRFFKTNKGEYGEGDICIGVVVPDQRKVACEFKDAGFLVIKKLLASKVHEHRLTGAIILVNQFKEADKEYKRYSQPRHSELVSRSYIPRQTYKILKRVQDDGGGAHSKSHNMRGKIFDFYLKNTRRINNWDLVDLSAPYLGAHLLDCDRSIIYQLAKSKNIWERRIAIMFTYAFIRENQLEDTFRVAELLLRDEHDLIHTAVGWMLREAGKRDQRAEELFLEKHYKHMPRTMLRYAIEKFSESKRKQYMA